jgi:hypothetical protein
VGAVASQVWDTYLSKMSKALDYYGRPATLQWYNYPDRYPSVRKTILRAFHRLNVRKALYGNGPVLQDSGRRVGDKEKTNSRLFT